MQAVTEIFAQIVEAVGTGQDKLTVAAVGACKATRQ